MIEAGSADSFSPSVGTRPTQEFDGVPESLSRLRRFQEIQKPILEGQNRRTSERGSAYAGRENWSVGRGAGSIDAMNWKRMFAYQGTGPCILDGGCRGGGALPSCTQRLAAAFKAVPSLSPSLFLIFSR